MHKEWSADEIPGEFDAIKSLVYMLNILKHKVVLWEKDMKRDQIDIDIKDLFFAVTDGHTYFGGHLSLG